MNIFEPINFIRFTFIDFLDILVVGSLIYYIYKMLRGTVAINILVGIAIVFVMWKTTSLMGMDLLSGILGQFIGMGFLALVVVFQQEIRNFLLTIGSTKITTHASFLKKLFSFLPKEEGNLKVEKNTKILISACAKMGSQRTGALIVLERNQSLEFVRNTGDKMNIELNQPIIESIFYKNSPLHDGAIIIEDGVVVATRVILPVVSKASENVPKHYGLRHRAAMSITEKTDATALVVSEETGKVSYFKNGEFVFYNDFGELAEIIGKDLEE